MITQDKLLSLSTGLPDQGYSMGGTRRLIVGDRYEETTHREKYAKSCRYRPTYGYYDYSLTEAEAERAEVIGGILTLVDPGQTGFRRCVWLEASGSKQHFSVVRRSGFVGLVAGVHAETCRECRAESRKIIDLRKMAAKISRGNRAGRKRALADRYTIADALAAHNCRPGVIAFARAAKLKLSGSYTGSRLMKLGQKHGVANNVTRMISMRLAQYLSYA